MTAIVALTAVSAWAQGTVAFANYLTGTTPPILARTYATDGTTLLDGSAGWVAGLFYQDPAAANAWTMLGAAQPYRTGLAAGRLTLVNLTVPNIAGGQLATMQLRAWNTAAGSTWAAANAVIGAQVSPDTAPSVVVRLGDPNSTPPGVPANLIDVNTSLALAGHSLVVVVPEPSTILLGLAGIGGLLFIRRKMA